MKITLDLPEDLIHTVKQTATHEKRNWKEVVTQILQMSFSETKQKKKVVAKTLPVFRSESHKASHKKMKPQEMVNIVKIAEQDIEVKQYEASFGY